LTILSQALLGFEHKLTHLDGHNITLGRKGVTQPGTSNSSPLHRSADPPCVGFVHVMKGEGMPVFGSDLHGDLYVEYKVVLPLELSPPMRQSESLL
jgi:DnaJ-related protein SCJ1